MAALLAASSSMALSSRSCVAQRPFAAAAALPARPVQRLQVVAAKPTKAQEFR